MKFLLDTCVLSEFVKPQPSQSLLNFISEHNDGDMYISSMTLAELHRGVVRMDDGKRKSDLIYWLDEIEESFKGRLLDFDSKVAVTWAKICTIAEKKGKKLSAFDSIIAAIASSNELVMVTRNVKDFEASGVEIINPW